MVSTNYDKDISQLIADAIWEVGIDGLIEIEPGNQMETMLFVLIYYNKKKQFTQGIGLNRPYVSDKFILDNKTTVLDLNYPYILVVDHEIK